MEQKSKSKLTFGSFFIIFLIVIYFGNRGSNEINKKLDNTNQALHRMTLELKQLKKEVKQLKEKISVSVSLESTNSRTATNIIANSSDSIKQRIINKEQIDVQNVVKSNEKDKPILCCETDFWDEDQEYIIRGILNQEIASGLELSIEEVNCKENSCVIDVLLYGSKGISELSKVMGKFDILDADVLNLERVENNDEGVTAKIVLVRTIEIP